MSLGSKQTCFAFFHIDGERSISWIAENSFRHKCLLFIYVIRLTIFKCSNESSGRNERKFPRAHFRFNLCFPHIESFALCHVASSCWPRACRSVHYVWREIKIWTLWCTSMFFLPSLCSYVREKIAYEKFNFRILYYPRLSERRLTTHTTPKQWHSLSNVDSLERTFHDTHFHPWLDARCFVPRNLK